MSDNPKNSFTYKSAGVDIDAGESLVKRIKPLAQKTSRPEVLGGIGGFGALFQLDWQRYKQPVLVSGTDGVGTKLKIANMMNNHETIGIDLVAMCVNDILVSGAEPLFFLDYYASSKLDVNTAEKVITGISEGCLQAGCALAGGETAEMPGFYQPGEYDLAGFCVGIVEKNQIISGEAVAPGNILLGLSSSGAHSNGYSLIRKIIEVSQTPLSTPLENTTLGAALLAPTRIYVKSILHLLKKVSIHAMAHITGGGLTENLPRVLPAHCKAVIHKDAWPQTALFAWIQTHAHLSNEEMFRTFNCGIGFVICVSPDNAAQCKSILEAQGETVWEIGSIQPRLPTDDAVIFQ